MKVRTNKKPSTDSLYKQQANTYLFFPFDSENLRKPQTSTFNNIEEDFEEDFENQIFRINVIAKLK